MSVPFWVQDSVFYQIFPDRFANGDPHDDPPNVQPWGSTPTPWGFQGGDLRGILDKLDYLLDLGITAIYLNPIFQATSTHRYNTTDYYRIDPKLGSERDFHAFLDMAHANGLRVILDGVFNHCGRGFFAFNDLLENQENSPYRDWFHVNHFPVDAYSPGEARDYLGWWNLKSLPKFNTDNPDVRNFLLGVARYWIERGADGWRLDVPNEIDDDSFWDEFRQTVHSANPDAYLVGEIWDGSPRWANDRHFDGLINYPVRTALLQLLNDGQTVTRFADRVEEIYGLYPRENAQAMFSVAGTHDTERILTLCEGNLAKVKLAWLFLFTYPGTPVIYYGDEIGLEGGKDPDNRRAFPWDPARWKSDLRGALQQLIAIRKRCAPLRRGTLSRVRTDDARGCYAFARSYAEEKILIVLNASETSRRLHVPVESLAWTDGQILHNLMNGEQISVAGSTMPVALPPWSGAIIQN